MLRKTVKNLGLSAVLGIMILLCLSVIGAELINQEILGEKLIGAYGTAVSAIGIFACARTMTRTQKERDLLSAALGGSAVLLVLVLGKLIWFQETKQEIVLQFGSGIAAILLAALLPRGRRQKRGNKRFVQFDRKRSA